MNHHHRECSIATSGCARCASTSISSTAPKRRDERVDEAAGERVADSLPHDQAEVEQPVAQDGVGERRGHRERDEHQQRHCPRREDVRSGIAQVADDNGHAGRGADNSAHHQHPEAAPFGQGGGGSPVRQQQHHRQGGVRDVHPEHRHDRVRYPRRRPERTGNLVPGGDMPSDHQRRRQERENEPATRPGRSREHGKKGEQQRTYRYARRSRQPEQDAEGCRQPLPEDDHPHWRRERQRRHRGEKQGAQQGGRVGIPSEGDDECEGERDDLRQAEGEQPRPWRPRPPFTQPSRKSQPRDERTARAFELEIERPRRIEPHADALPVRRPLHSLAGRSQDAVPRQKAAARAGGACLHARDDHRASLKQRHEPGRDAAQVARHEQGEVTDVGGRHDDQTPAESTDRMTGSAGTLLEVRIVVRLNCQRPAGPRS
ncbi:MAG: hypothetical protein ABIX28_19535 [Vicinamibacterales bacterium]